MRSRFYDFYPIFLLLGILVICFPFISRFFNYLCLIGIIFLSDFVVELWKSNRFVFGTRYILLTCILSMVLLWNGRYYFSDMSDLTGKNMRKYVHWYPYSSILDKTKNPDRESLQDYYSMINLWLNIVIMKHRVCLVTNYLSAGGLERVLTRLATYFVEKKKCK